MSGSSTSATRLELYSRILLTLGALLPYWPLLGFSVIHVPDDGFSSDLWNGELPSRVLLGELVSSGLPAWTQLSGAGLPVLGPFEPLSFVAFWLLPPAVALDALLVAWLLVAAHGTYGFCSRLGATRSAAVLAGLAFAGSGYLACQLRHLAIVSTVVWLPVGLLCLERALGPTAGGRGSRLLWSSLFGLTLAEQSISGFPQSAYYCALTYGAYASYRALLERARWLVPAGVAAVLGALGGAVALLPLLETSARSSRTTSLSFEWATRQNYWPPNVLTFFVPYLHGDASDASYRGSTSSVFWEDYAYVGLAPVLLALYAAARDLRRPSTRFFVGLLLVAFAFVLGRETPIYRVAFELVPGFSGFRFSTRCLVLVDFALAVLAAAGLSRLQGLFAARGQARLAAILGASLCVLTALDLLWHQPRQNAFVSADRWLAPPRTARLLAREPKPVRVFTPYHKRLHLLANRAARGYRDPEPYYRMRELLAPNSNLYWNVATADAYWGLTPAWQALVWGDHNQRSQLVYRTMVADMEAGTLHTTAAFIPVMRALGVTHVIATLRVPALPSFIDAGNGVKIHRVPDAARVRIVPRARFVASDDRAAAVMLGGDFDPDREVVLQGPASPSTDDEASLGAELTAQHETATSLEVGVRVARAGYLVVADNYDPGWRAWVDERPVPVLRANIATRAVLVPPGRHRVRFAYDRPSLRTGLALSAGAWLLLLSSCAGFARQTAWATRTSRGPLP